MKSENELRELDAWCAKNVMGLKRMNSPAGIEPGTFFWNENKNGFGEVLIHKRGNTIQTFHPTEDPAAAMLVLEKCAEKLLAREVNESVGIVGSSQSGWTVFTFRSNGIILQAEAETLPLAICLLAKEIFK